MVDVRLIVYDFDGVLTDNRVWVTQEGVESVACSRSDGWWIGRIRELGIDQLILSTEKNPVVGARAAKLGLEAIQDQADKRRALVELLGKRALSAEHVVYVGNDTNDAECLRLVGHPMCPRDANPEIVGLCRHVLPADGGQGIVYPLFKWLSDRNARAAANRPSDLKTGLKTGLWTRVWTQIWNRHVVPQITRRGFRASQSIPLDDAHLSGRFGYDDEDEIKRAVAAVRANTMVGFERLATLWQQVRYLDRFGIDGTFVECGVWKGGSVGMLALAHLASKASPSRELHLFDSFEGLPEPDARVDGDKATRYSNEHATGALKPIGRCDGAQGESRALLEGRLGYPERLVRYHVGWFQDTVARDAPTMGPIALLRLDGDWYESTRVCLEHLYAKVVAGGVVVIDDYGHWEGCRRAVDEFTATLGKPVFLNHVDYTGRYWLKT